jgi:hypothetical protein
MAKTLHSPEAYLAGTRDDVYPSWKFWCGDEFRSGVTPRSRAVVDHLVTRGIVCTSSSNKLGPIFRSGVTISPETVEKAAPSSLSDELSRLITHVKNYAASQSEYSYPDLKPSPVVTRDFLAGRVMKLDRDVMGDDMLDLVVARYGWKDAGFMTQLVDGTWAAAINPERPKLDLLETIMNSGSTAIKKHVSMKIRDSAIEAHKKRNAAAQRDDSEAKDAADRRADVLHGLSTYFIARSIPQDGEIGFDSPFGAIEPIISGMDVNVKTRAKELIERSFERMARRGSIRDIVEARDKIVDVGSRALAARRKIASDAENARNKADALSAEIDAAKREIEEMDKKRNVVPWEEWRKLREKSEELSKKIGNRMYPKDAPPDSLQGKWLAAHKEAGDKEDKNEYTPKVVDVQTIANGLRLGVGSVSFSYEGD